MTGVVRVDKCVAVHWCGVVVVTLRRVVTAKKGEEAKTAKAPDVGGTHGAKRRSSRNTTSGRTVSATSPPPQPRRHQSARRPMSSWVPLPGRGLSQVHPYQIATGVRGVGPR